MDNKITDKKEKIEKFAESLNIQKFKCIENLTDAFLGFSNRGEGSIAVYDFYKAVQILEGEGVGTANNVLEGFNSKREQGSPLFVKLLDENKIEKVEEWGLCIAIVGGENSEKGKFAEGISYFTDGGVEIYPYSQDIKESYIAACEGLEGELGSFEHFKIIEAPRFFDKYLREGKVAVIDSIEEPSELISLAAICSHRKYKLIVFEVTDPKKETVTKIPKESISCTFVRNATGVIDGFQKTLQEISSKVKNFPKVLA
jgi:hypothetical protein